MIPTATKIIITHKINVWNYSDHYVDNVTQVFVGEGGLNYSVGFLRYHKAQSSGDRNIHLLIIIAPVLAGVVILILITVTVLCCSAGIVIRRKRAYKAKQR